MVKFYTGCRYFSKEGSVKISDFPRGIKQGEDFPDVG